MSSVRKEIKTSSRIVGLIREKIRRVVYQISKRIELSQETENNDVSSVPTDDFKNFMATCQIISQKQRTNREDDSDWHDTLTDSRA